MDGNTHSSQRMGKACKIGQQAKEFYPDEIAFDFKLAGCYAAMGKAIERDYFLQNVRSSKANFPKYPQCFPI